MKDISLENYCALGKISFDKQELFDIYTHEITKKNIYVDFLGNTFVINEDSNYNNEVDLELVGYVKPFYKEYRICSTCKRIMIDGYCIENGEDYYCCDKCLLEDMTMEEYLELNDNDNGDSYWTTWEEENNLVCTNCKEKIKLSSDWQKCSCGAILCFDCACSIDGSCKICNNTLLVQIGSDKADEIIDTRKPIGLFFLMENNKFTGIDNSSNDAWTEVFNTYKEVERYLTGCDDDFNDNTITCDNCKEHVDYDSEWINCLCGSNLCHDCVCDYEGKCRFCNHDLLNEDNQEEQVSEVA